MIDADRKAIERHGQFKLLPKDLDVDAFEASVRFHQNIARITNDSLRRTLENFYKLCTEFTLPPDQDERLTPESSLAILDTRYRKLAEAADSVTIVLGEHLRTELNRGSVSHSKEPDQILDKSATHNPF